MAIRATGVTRAIRMMPIADDAGSKNQQRYERQGYPEYANGLPHVHLD